MTRKVADVGDELAQILAPFGLDGRIAPDPGDRTDVVEELDGGRPAELVDAPVVGDAVEPGAQGHRPVVGAQRAVGAHEDVLQGVLGLDRRTGEHPARIGEQPGPVAIVDDAECVLVAETEQRHELVVGPEPQEYYAMTAAETCGGSQCGGFHAPTTR